MYLPALPVDCILAVELPFVLGRFRTCVQACVKLAHQGCSEMLQVLVKVQPFAVCTQRTKAKNAFPIADRVGYVLPEPLASNSVVGYWSHVYLVPVRDAAVVELAT